MAVNREKTLADYLVIAISPALIMVLVGSLVFFLLEVLYQGGYQGKLQWILFFFVFGAVLIARISMQGEIAGRAKIYGIILGLLVWLALLRFVEYPQGHALSEWNWVINIGLIGIIWWCAHRLTWDCTLIDEEVDASGQGLLQLAGLEQAGPEKESPSTPQNEKKAGEKGLLGWWSRYQKYRAEQKKKPQAPGVWVVYFSLAALPVFGLGQTLIPVQDAGRRIYVFWLMVFYVSSGLGLLLTTCFLGLRRYLRQRKVQMPKAMAGMWIFLGVIFIGGLLLIGALIPRPDSTHPLINWRPLGGTPDRKASDYAKVGENLGKGKGKSTGQQGKADEKGQGSKSQQKQGASNQGGKEKNSKKTGGDGDSNKQSNSASNGKKDGQGRSQTERKTSKDGDEKKQKDDDPQRPGDSEQTGTSPSPPGAISQFFSTLSNVLFSLLKWIIIGLIILLLFFFLFRSGLAWLANFTDWAKRWLAVLQKCWAKLSAFFEKKGETKVADGPEILMAPPRPFSAFANPFSSGAADQWAVVDLLRYSFDALEAWARERGSSRGMGETPLEFVQRLGDSYPALEKHFLAMGHAYAGLAYAKESGNQTEKNPLRLFWESLEGTGKSQRSPAVA